MALVRTKVKKPKPPELTPEEKEKLRLAKNQRIKQTQQENKERREGLTKQIIVLKIVANKTSPKVKNKLDLTFVEAKWVTNYCRGAQYPFNVVIGKTVLVKIYNPITQKCDIIEERKLEVLGSQIKQSIIKQTQQDIIALSEKKARGGKVGKLKFCSEVNTLSLKQHGVTFNIKGSRVSIQNVGSFRVRGTDQLTPEMEITQAKLVRKPTGIYLHVLTYSKPKVVEQNGSVGIDFGVKDPVTLSTGATPDLLVEFPKALRIKHRKFSRKKKGSCGHRKGKIDLSIAYERYSNKKNDKANKFIGSLKQFSHVGYQDDTIAGWKMIWGRKIQQSALGRIKEKLIGLSTAHKVARFIPTTKECPKCLKLNDFGLEVRTYTCACGFSDHRDTKSAKAILCYSMSKYSAYTSVEYRSLSVEDRASVYKSYDFSTSTSVDTESLDKPNVASTMPCGLPPR